MGMLRKLLFTFGIMLALSSIAYPQGTLKGKITDGKEPIPYANIIIVQGGKQFGGAQSDLDGNYTIKPIPPGKYDVKATYVGYQTSSITGVLINADKITFLDVKMSSTSIEIVGATIIWERPLIDKDNTVSSETMSSEEIKRVPGRSAQGMAASMAGVQGNDGAMGSVRGARTDGTVTYIDGVKVAGTSSLPKSAIEEVSMVMGGVPAKYGEATGGVLNITTKGPSRQFGGSVELVGSLDGYNNFIGSFSLNGPLIKSKNKDDVSSLLGFFISGEFTYGKDAYPAQGGSLRMKSDVIQRIKDNPLLPVGYTGINYYNSEFLKSTDMETIHARENNNSLSANFAGKLDVKVVKNSNLTFGGSYDYNKYRNWSIGNAMLNADRIGESQNSTMRVYGKFSQRFLSGDTSSFVKNVFYQVQLDYTKVNSHNYDVDHKDNIFNYGYIGKFKTYKNSFYERKDVTIDNIEYKDVMTLTNYYDTLVTFERSEVNPYLANYTSNYYDLFSSFDNKNDYYRNYTQLQSGFGLLNGDMPNSVFGLYAAPGTVNAGNGKSQLEQIGFNANGSADIGNHAFEFGFQYEQRSSSGYSVNDPAGLWTLMRQLTNSHIKQLDLDNPMRVYVDDGFGNLTFADTIKYNLKYDQGSQKYFDINLRKKLGLAVNGTDWVDVDNLDPSTYSIDMFSADELLNDGYSYVTYYGYDHKGNKTSGKTSMEDFLTAKDENGNKTRSIGAYEPIYMAGYLQDKFAFDDLIFNIGVRVDRFDANQQVLKDNYLVAPAKSVSEAADFVHPSNMGSDYVVYVDDATNPTKVMGYRNGSDWYNAQGQVITDPSLLSSGTSTGRVTPYLVNPTEYLTTNTKISSKAFKDYEPQFSVMPRVSFSFPVSDKALFFAHYDVITKRPTSGVFMNPVSYLFIEKIGTSDIANPSLKPEKKVDYELGFKQVLNKKSAVTITAYYSEQRDQVQAFRFSEAYPNTYYSFNNIDFGTVQGFSLSYDLRKSDNIRLRASYTLQFAKGTGSDATSSKSIVASGQPNLRTLSNLSFDQRHAVKANVDYRFGVGKDYNGPKTKKATKDGKIKTINWFENTGINFTFSGSSGSPYTRSSQVTSLTGVGTSQISGNLYGSNLPWQFWIDARIDKEFMLTLKNDKDNPKNNKYGYLAVYLEVMNLFNFKNVTSVYAYTGNPDDDGFLAAAEYQKQINSYTDPQSFIDYYRSYLTNNNNYSLPRRINLGVQFGF
jgi:hypothetical protein